MRVLVTGGAGYVGSFAARALLASGHEIVVLDDLSRGHVEALPAGVLVVGDLADAALLERLLRERGVEAVMHFAAWSQVGESVQRPREYYRNNVANSLGLLEAMLGAGVRNLVFSSSCSVYAPDAPMPLTEDSALGPVSPYASSKRMLERVIEDFASAYGLRYASLRYFNAAGATRDGGHGEDHTPESHLIPIVLQVAQKVRERVDVFGDDYPTPDGTCVRDYVHVEDLARAHELALERLASAREGGGRVYNLGTGSGHSVREVIACAERVTGLSIPTRVVARRFGDAPCLVAAGQRAARELGWTPLHDLESIVASAWEWHRLHPHGYADRPPSARAAGS
jgi:UDP-glucose 4-epimerase